MSSDNTDAQPSTIAAKRLGGKAPPKLPLSLFANASAASPLSADPSTVFPSSIIDSNVSVALSEWKKSAGAILKLPISGLVMSSSAVHPEKEPGSIPTEAQELPVKAIIAPTHLADRGVSKLPAHVTSSGLPVSLAISFSRETPSLAEDISMALKAGHCVDLDVPWNAAQAESDSEWDALEETLGKAVEALPKEDRAKPIVIGNLLPPPHSLTVPIVKLLRHPTYQAYQAHISTLSFIPNTYLKFLPASWKEPTPLSPGPGASFSTTTEQVQKNNLNKEEWKRRVKMYLGPALDAFGFSRIMFGTSPSPSSNAPSTPHDWYMLVKEVVAELAVDQQGIDAIFGGTAQNVYGA